MHGTFGTAETYGGSRYDPVNDSWAPIPQLGAPEFSTTPSSGVPTPLWTGSKLVAYGLAAAEGSEDRPLSGGFYDPSAPSSGAWSQIRDDSGAEKILFLYAKP